MNMLGKVSIDEIKDRNYNLDIKNPHIEEVEEEYTLEELLNNFKRKSKRNR